MRKPNLRLGGVRPSIVNSIMGFWSKQETELHLNIDAGDPHHVRVYTNWQYYLTRFERCEGFEGRYAHEPQEGGRVITGVLDISEFNYLFLRRTLGSDRAERAFWQARAELPAEPVRVESSYRIGSGERETHFLVTAADPYWLHIETDAAVWMRRLDEHPFAVCVAETQHGREEDDETEMTRAYKLPRSLLTVRKARPQYTEEYRQELRERLGVARATG